MNSLSAVSDGIPGGQFIATIEKRISGEIRSLRSVAPDAPPELLAICEKAIARNRDDRYATAADFQDALETYLQNTDPGAGPKQIGAVVAAAFAKERSTMRTRIEAQLTALAGAPSKLALVDVPATEADASGRHLAVITSGATAVTKMKTLLPCDPAATGDDACAQQFIAAFGKKAFRRPLADVEKATLFGLYQTNKSGADFANGIQAVVEAVHKALATPEAVAEGTAV